MKRNKLRLVLLSLIVCSFCYCQSDTLVDIRDGQVYKTLKVADQTWMAENMRYIDTLYLVSKNDSLLIKAGYFEGWGSGWLGDYTSDKEKEHWRNWMNNLNRFALCYNDSISNCRKYGALYTWESANKACPKGWHLPSNEEYDQLFISLGAAKHQNIRSIPHADLLRLNFKLAGDITSLKLVGPRFYGLSKWGAYWTSTEITKPNRPVTMRVVYYSNNKRRSIKFLNMYYGGYHAYSVRCVKDK